MIKRKLVNILKSKKKITQKFYQQILETRQYNHVLKKIQMYIKGDGRLSVTRLINDINQNNQKGGGGDDDINLYNYGFGGYDFSFLSKSIVNKSEIKLADIPTLVLAPNICKEENKIKKMDLTNPVASGGFAQIYYYNETQTQLVKLFF